jgi:hypothetical protein
VGLIFLSAMASSIASDGIALDLTPEVQLGTALVTLAGSCAIVGALMMAVGGWCGQSCHTFQDSSIYSIYC